MCSARSYSDPRLHFVERWLPIQLERYHIGLLDAVVLFWGDLLIPDYVGNFSYVLDNTDNTRAEWSARLETPHQTQLQRVVTERQKRVARVGARSKLTAKQSKDLAHLNDLDRLFELAEEGILSALKASYHHGDGASTSTGPRHSLALPRWGCVKQPFAFLIHRLP